MPCDRPVGKESVTESTTPRAVENFSRARAKATKVCGYFFVVLQLRHQTAIFGSFCLGREVLKFRASYCDPDFGGAAARGALRQRRRSGCTNSRGGARRRGGILLLHQEDS